MPILKKYYAVGDAVYKYLLVTGSEIKILIGVVVDINISNTLQIAWSNGTVTWTRADHVNDISVEPRLLQV